MIVTVVFILSKLYYKPFILINGLDFSNFIRLQIELLGNSIVSQPLQLVALLAFSCLIVSFNNISIVCNLVGFDPVFLTVQ